MRKLACILGVIVMAGGSSARAQFQLTPAQQAWVDRTLAQMTLDEKIGQVMFAVCPAAASSSPSSVVLVY